MTQQPQWQATPPAAPYPPQQYPAQTPPGQYPQQPSYGNVPPAQPSYGTPPPQAGPADEFNAPSAPTGGGEGVGIHQLGNRLVLFRPLSYDPMAAPMPGVENARPGPLVMAEAIVLDGPPIPGSVNGMTEVMTPFPGGPKSPPFYVASMYVRGAVLPGQLEASVPSRSFVLGRIVKGTPSGKGKPPWVLLDFTEQDQQLARSIIGPRIADGFDAIKRASAPAPTTQPFAPAGYPGAVAQNPYGAPPQQPQYPQQPQSQPAHPQSYGQPDPSQQPPQGPPGAPWQQQQPQAAPPAPAAPPWQQPVQAPWPPQ